MTNRAPEMPPHAPMMAKMGSSHSDSPRRTSICRPTLDLRPGLPRNFTLTEFHKLSSSFTPFCGEAVEGWPGGRKSRPPAQTGGPCRSLHGGRRTVRLRPGHGGVGDLQPPGPPEQKTRRKRRTLHWMVMNCRLAALGRLPNPQGVGDLRGFRWWGGKAHWPAIPGRAIPGSTLFHARQIEWNAVSCSRI